ncbi:MAG: MFS transporter [Actinomycetia bacterium]|nr:MFS transporter [Actinomycetes bacterium]MCP5030241.1 MFS transporter [Actinomycetes bacterium]
MSDQTGYEPAEQDEPAELVELLGRWPVRNLLISRACSSSGAVTLAIAMGVFVFDITGREVDIGFVGLAEFLPTFLLVLWAGSLADRVDRRKMAAVAYGAEAVIAFVIAWYSTTDPTAVWPLLTLTAAYGAARGFANPPSRALPANVVSRRDLPRLIPALSTVWQLATVFAPLIVGVLYGVSPAWTFVAIGILDAIAAITIVRVDLHSAQERIQGRPSISDALQGLRLVGRTPLLLAAIGLDLFAVLLGGVVALAPPIAEQLLGANDSAPFWMRSAGGLGAAVTAALLARKPIERNVGRVLLQAVAVFGLLTIGIAISRNLFMTLALFALLAAADMVSVFIRATIVPLATPDSLRGRVLAVEAVFIGASNELGAFESGVTAELFGLVPAIVVSGIATIAVVGLFALFVPDLRRLDRFAEIDAALTTERN